MKMFYKILFAAAVVALAPSLREGRGGLLFAQQDAQYSQYMFNQLALNPAFAGSHELLSNTMMYRRQWTGIQGAPTTGSLSVQMPLKKKKIGVGAEILSDKTGPKTVSSILLSYAYRVPLAKGKLSFGLRMGMSDYVFDWSKMDYKDKSDLYNSGDRTSKFTGTGDFGLYYYTRTFYWGMGVNHLNRGKIIVSGNDSAARQAIHIFMPVGKAFQAGNVVINPTLLLKYASNAPAEADVSVNVLIKESCWIGLSARSGYGFVFLTQYKVNDHLKIGYSFDYGINKIGTAGKGSHEIMIGYDLSLHGTKIIMPRYL
jgi:type IX secretion system PorP/SprF family membrane protein